MAPGRLMQRLRLLGEPVLLDAQGAGVACPWRTHVALLARLAVSPDLLVSRAVLCGLLWPGSPESRARTSLRQALFQLRREMGAVVVPAGAALRLDTGCLEVDVREFERLLDAGRPADALAQYVGPFLFGFSLPSSVEFAHWADGERARLARRAASAFEGVIERAAAAGAWGEALRWTERWLALDPCSGAAAERSMTLRAQLGDTAGALDFHEAFRARVREELGVEPAAGIEALAERIRRSPPAHALTAGSAAQPPAEPPLVGREPEFRRIAERWNEAVAGRHQLVLLVGEPGMGKTRLAHEFGRWVGLRGATVLRGRSYRIEQGVPYAGLLGVLRAALGAPGLAAVGGAALGELARLVPEIATRFRSGVAPPSADLETGRVRLLEAFRELIENLAFEAPVLLVLDDLPWADEATLSAVHYIWRRLPDVPLLVLGTARTADLDANAPLDRLLATVRHEDAGDAASIQLTPLDRQAIAQLAAFMSGPGATATGDDVVAELERESGGNPLFVIAALRARATGGGATAARESLRAGTAEMLAALSPDEGSLLRAAAVLGRPFPLPLGGAVAALDHDRAVAALEVLLERRLLRGVEYEYDFVHDLIREAVYEGLGVERRAMLHRRAWARLAPRADEDVGLERASAVARHAIGAGLRAEGYTWLLRAAQLAKSVFAGEEAEELLTRATDFAESAAELRTAWEWMGELRHAQSRFAAAAEAYRRAISHTDPGTRDRTGLRVKLLDTSIRAGLVSITDAAPIFDDLLVDAATAGRGCHRDALLAAANGYLRSGELLPAEQYAIRAMDAAREAAGGAETPEDTAAPAALVKALLLRAQIGTIRGSLPDALHLLEEAAELAARHHLERERLDVEIEVATELCRQGRWTDAIAGWSRVVSRSEAASAVGAEAIARLNLSDVLLRRGEWDNANTHLEIAQALARRYDFPHVYVDVLVNRALGQWHRGEADATVAAARIALDAAEAAGMATASHAARALLALGLLELGNLGSARDVLHTAATPPGPAHPTGGDLEFHVAARARLHCLAGDRSAAAALLDAALADTTEPYAAAFLKLELALTVEQDDPRRAATLREDARATLRTLGAAPLLRRYAPVA
jgi:DNA-binding SARP family transcriptional activator/tetratricopeptide (TPR) repeat protein